MDIKEALDEGFKALTSDTDRIKLLKDAMGQLEARLKKLESA